MLARMQKLRTAARMADLQDDWFRPMLLIHSPNVLDYFLDFKAPESAFDSVYDYVSPGSEPLTIKDLKGILEMPLVPDASDGDAVMADLYARLSRLESSSLEFGERELASLAQSIDNLRDRWPRGVPAGQDPQLVPW